MAHVCEYDYDYDQGCRSFKKSGVFRPSLQKVKGFWTLTKICRGMNYDSYYEPLYNFNTPH